MSEPSQRRFSRLFSRKPGVPTERDWDRSVLLEPRPAPFDPELISDGGGLPFPPAALLSPAAELDREDPAVKALIAELARQKGHKNAARGPGNTGPSLDGWRLLARTDDEAMFGRGHPPKLVTVAVRQDVRRRPWSCVGVSTARPLRATRDGIRASGWRPDPTREASVEDGVLRVFVTEQTWAGGTRADSRLLAPNLYSGADELVLTMFVQPRLGFQVRSPNPETLARIALPSPIGQRRLIDGALYDGAARNMPDTDEADTEPQRKTP